MFEIRVNGKLFELWESASVQRTMEENSGKFQFTASDTFPAFFPVKVGDEVTIVIDGEPRITGYVDELSSEGDVSSHTITISGRDNVEDLIDSSVPDEAKTIETPISLKAFAERVIGALGANIPVTVRTQVSDFTEDTGITADSGRKAMEFIESFARKKQVSIVSDGAGGIVIFRPGEAVVSSPILNIIDGRNNNVKTFSLKRNNSGQFGKYKTRTQGNYGFGEDYEDDDVDINSEAVDETIRSSRYLEFQAEEFMTGEEVTNRAEEELNLRRALGVEYNCTLVGVRAADGTMWDIGQTITVKDELAGISGQLIIRSVEYTSDLQGGNRTVITAAPPEAFQARKPTAGDLRKASIGDRLVNSQPNPTSTAGNASQRGLSTFGKGRVVL